MEPNAFAPEFLDEHDEPATSLETSTSGPWRVVALDREQWGVLQEGDAAPRAVFKDRELALVAAAMIPASGRDLRLLLSTEAVADGFAVGTQGSKTETVGWLPTFDAETVDCLNAALHLVLSPPSLALLLEAAGPTALRRAGAILAERLETKAAETARESPAEG